MPEVDRSDPDADPLEHADIGTTKTIRRETTLYCINHPPDVYFGNDRFVADDNGPTRVDVWIGDHGTGGVVWEADVTKTLPRRPFNCNAPLTEKGRRRQRRRERLERIGRVAAILIPSGLIFGLSWWFTNQTTKNLTVNGEPIGPVTLMDAVPIFLLFSLVALLASSVTAGWPVPASIGRMGGHGR